MQTPQLMGGGLSALLPCSVCVYPYTPIVDDPCVESIETAGGSPIRYPSGVDPRVSSWPGLLTLEIIASTITHSPSIVGNSYSLVWDTDQTPTDVAYPAGWANATIDDLDGNPLVMAGLASGPGTLTHQVSVGAMCNVQLSGEGTFYKFLAIRIGGEFGGGASAYTWVTGSNPTMRHTHIAGTLHNNDVLAIEVSDWGEPIDETFDIDLRRVSVPAVSLGTMTVRLYEPT